MWREECVNSNWLNINEDLAYRTIISCTNVNKIKYPQKYLFKTKCKWENKVGGVGDTTPPLRIVGGQNIDSRNSKGPVVVVIAALAIATSLTQTQTI
jgi:hypothetical protein